VAQFKRGDYSTCDTPRPGRQNSDQPGDYWSNSRANLGRQPAGFRLNQQLSNWVSHLSGWGPPFMKICTCGTSSRSGSRKAWPRIKNFNGVSRLSDFWNAFVWRDPNDFLLRLVTMEETWLYPCDPETKQPSTEWRHSGSTCPKKIRVQKFAGKFSPRFFRIKKASTSVIIFQRAKLSTRSVAHLCWCNWRTF
jgi:hypothetical protein